MLDLSDSNLAIRLINQVLECKGVNNQRALVQPQALRRGLHMRSSIAIDNRQQLSSIRVSRCCFIINLDQALTATFLSNLQYAKNNGQL